MQEMQHKDIFTGIVNKEVATDTQFNFVKIANKRTLKKLSKNII